MNPFLVKRLMKAVQKPLDDDGARALFTGNNAVYVSPKMDGVRGCVQAGHLMYASLKLVPNHFLQHKYGIDALNGLDFEMILGNPMDKMCFRNTTSAVRRIQGEPLISLYVFDYIDQFAHFDSRFLRMRSMCEGRFDLKLVPQVAVRSADALFAQEKYWLDAGFEGVIIRPKIDRDYYKYGRVTATEGHIFKRVPWHIGEAVVVGTKPRMTNTNEPFINERGLQKRSKDSAGLIDSGKIGGLVLFERQTGRTFTVSSGLSSADSERTDWVGKTVSFKARMDGGYDNYRQPVFRGERVLEDITSY